VPLHSRQYQALPEVYVQDSSLEIAWTRVTDGGLQIAGDRVLGHMSEGLEGFSIDYPDDWERAELAVTAGDATLPVVPQPPFEAALPDGPRPS